MTPLERTRRRVMADEGFRGKPYRCTAGKLTIGYGRNLEDRGVTESEAAILLDNDLALARAQLVARFPWFPQLDDARQAVLVNMAFNLGIAGLAGFVRTLEAIKAGEYTLAAGHMLHSRWAAQVGARATRLARSMASGEWV